MHSKYHHLQDLHQRMRIGDTAAIHEFFHEFWPVIQRIVRRSIRSGSEKSPLTMGIRKLVEQFPNAMDDNSFKNDDLRLRQFAHALCRMTIAALNVQQLSPSPPPRRDNGRLESRKNATLTTAFAQKSEGNRNLQHSST